jgi:hypothetical protein
MFYFFLFKILDIEFSFISSIIEPEFCELSIEIVNFYKLNSAWLYLFFDDNYFFLDSGDNDWSNIQSIYQWLLIIFFKSFLNFSKF